MQQRSIGKTIFLTKTFSVRLPFHFFSFRSFPASLCVIACKSHLTPCRRQHDRCSRLCARHAPHRLLLARVRIVRTRFQFNCVERWCDAITLCSFRWCYHKYGKWRTDEFTRANKCFAICVRVSLCDFLRPSQTRNKSENDSKICTTHLCHARRHCATRRKKKLKMLTICTAISVRLTNAITCISRSLAAVSRRWHWWYSMYSIWNGRDKCKWIR